MKCLECEKCELITKDYGYTEAVCRSSKSGKRVITWAHTVYRTEFDAVMRLNGTEGRGRVEAALKKQKIYPSWCPRKEEAQCPTK